MNCQDRQIKAKEGSRSSTRKSLVFFDMEASMHRGPHSGARLQCDHGRAPRAASHRPVHVWFGRQGQRASTSEGNRLAALEQEDERAAATAMRWNALASTTGRSFPHSSRSRMARTTLPCHDLECCGRDEKPGDDVSFCSGG